MYQNKERSLLCTAYRLYKIGKVFAVSNFSIKEDSNNNRYTEVTRSDLAVLFGFVAFLIFLTYENVVYPQNISNKDDKIFNITTQIIIGGTPLISLLEVLKAFFDREQLMTVIFELNSIDERIKKLGIMINHSSNYRYVLIYLAVCYTSFVLYMFMFVAYLILSLKTSSVFYIIGCVFVNGMILVGMNKFHLILAVLYTRFTLLNDIILKTFNLIDTTSQEVLTTSPLETIVEVTRAHELLNATAIKTNYLFTHHILGTTLATFCMTLFPIYESFRNIFLEESSTISFLLMCLISSSMFHNSILFIAIILSEATKTASDRTAVVVHKAIAKESQKPIILQLRLLSQKIMHQSPTFGCCLFTYNWPFVFTYVAAIASYLVILIQFHNSFDSPLPES